MENLMKADAATRTHPRISLKMRRPDEREGGDREDLTNAENRYFSDSKESPTSGTCW